MKISNWKLVTKFLFGGGVSGVIEYALEVLKNALSALSVGTKDRIRAALNLALKVLSVLEAVKVLVPTKWQSAYVLTIVAVEYCCSALADLEITKDELDIVCDKIAAAYDAWRSPDDETCVELVCKGGKLEVA